MQSNEELKKRLLDMLEEDKEFRHAVAGAIGYKEILDRIVALEAQMNERFAKVEEEIRDLREETNRLRQDMLEGFRRHEEEMAKLRQDMQEGFKRHDEEFKRVWESIEKLRQDMLEGFRRHDKRLDELTVSIGSLGNRMGRDMEKMVLNIYRDQLTQLGIDEDKALRFEYIDREGLYGLKGKRYEFDVVLTNSHIDIMEVKSHADEDDIVTFYEKVNSIRQVIEQIHRAEIRRLVVVTVHIDKGALDKAKELGIECVYGYVISD